MRVMVAGVGGASLGTEIAKALRLSPAFTVFGCDISATAYGVGDSLFENTFVVDGHRYVESVLDACRVASAQWVIPGGERPTGLLTAAASALGESHIRLATNAQSVVAALSDKSQTFAILAAAGIEIPRTVDARSAEAVSDLGSPCVVKPATDSGGSALVFLAATTEDALVYAEHVVQSGRMPIAQEYIPEDEGEFTIGVLHGSDGTFLGSLALRRALDSKLSLQARVPAGVISSGYSQGYVDDFPEVRRQAQAIAEAVGSRGPLNVQGRVRDGVLVPFEINPRFSASTYLRALAGFNDVERFLRYECDGEVMPPARVRSGWYLRSLTEKYVSPEPAP